MGALILIVIILTLFSCTYVNHILIWAMLAFRHLCSTSSQHRLRLHSFNTLPMPVVKQYEVQPTQELGATATKHVTQTTPARPTEGVVSSTSKAKSSISPVVTTVLANDNSSSNTVTLDLRQISRVKDPFLSVLPSQRAVCVVTTRYLVECLRLCLENTGKYLAYQGRNVEKRVRLGVLECSTCGRLTQPKTDADTRRAQMRGPGRLCKKWSFHLACIHQQCAASAAHRKSTTMVRRFRFGEPCGSHSSHERLPGGPIFEEEGKNGSTA